PRATTTCVTRTIPSSAAMAPRYPRAMLATNPSGSASISVSQPIAAILTAPAHAASSGVPNPIATPATSASPATASDTVAPQAPTTASFAAAIAVREVGEANSAPNVLSVNSRPKTQATTNPNASRPPTDRI